MFSKLKHEKDRIDIEIKRWLTIFLNIAIGKQNPEDHFSIFLQEKPDILSEFKENIQQMVMICSLKYSCLRHSPKCVAPYT